MFVVTGVDGKEVLSQFSLYFLCDFPLPILYSYAKPYAKLIRGDLVSLRGTGYNLVFGGHNEGLSPTFLLLVGANLALLGASPLFSHLQTPSISCSLYPLLSTHILLWLRVVEALGLCRRQPWRWC